ncbi:MAG TPA: PadR family transcriptional regulator [Candidatus Thermoplasmatota archaeon]|nr:PadR family transcriptional regulator [Candidatus Thermoplasmatota archaeon]
MVASSPKPADLDRFREKHERELKSGVVSMLLLLAIDRSGPDYGYRILKNLQDWSDGRLAFKEGTAYPLLQNLEKSGLVTSYWGDGAGGPPRKYYQTTALGRDALKAAIADWEALTQSVEDILRNAPKGGKKE